MPHRSADKLGYRRHDVCLATQTSDQSVHRAATSEQDLLALDAALTELADAEPRQAAIVESRFFGGLEISEISNLLGASESTIQRDWRAAKAWLGQKLRRDE